MSCFYQNKKSQEACINFMNDLAQLLVSHNASLSFTNQGMELTFSIHGYAGILDQVYNELELVDDNQSTLHSVELSKN